LREKGFNVALPIYLKQYLATSPDGTVEVVLSYGKRVLSCGGETIKSGFKAELDREVRSLMKVTIER
jgi:hypothetical protein